MADPKSTKPLKEALKGVVSASGQTSRQRNKVQLSSDIQTIETHAKENGLPSNYFCPIMDIAASKKFSEAMSGKLIRSLIPETVVPEKAVIKAVSWMCTNIPSVNTQALLIRWINLVFDSIDGKERLHSLYGILFYFLDVTALLPHVCYLLYQLTQKEDVRMFRVRHLLKLQASRHILGGQPYLMGLLSLYKLFYPNLVTIVIPRQRKVLFRAVDVQWAAAIRRVREKHRSLVEITADMDTTRLRANQTLTTSASARPAKRAKLAVPGISSRIDVDAHADSSQDLQLFHSKSIPFLHIKDFPMLVENLENIEMPAQIGAVLQNSLLQHAVSCQHSSTTAARFNMWLQHTLVEVFIVSPDVMAVKQKEQLLQQIIKYSDFLQEGIPAVERFLEEYLATWNGQDFKGQLFELMSKLRMCPFSTLMEIILEPLRSLFFSSSVYFKCQVLKTLTRLLRNYCLIEWRRCQPLSSSSAESSSSEEEAKPDKKYMNLFDEGTEEFTPIETIRQFVEFVDRICCIGLMMEEDNCLLTNCALDFYEQVCQLYRYNIPLICLPSPAIVYKMLFGVSAVSVARICRLFCSYKTSVEYLKTKVSDFRDGVLNHEAVDSLNVYIRDTAASLWQYKASKVFNFSFPEDLGVYHLNESFSLHSHQALIGFAVQFLEKTQPQGTLVHPNSINASKNTKEIYLKYLENMELNDIIFFIKTFVKKRSQPRADFTSETVRIEDQPR